MKKILIAFIAILVVLSGCKPQKKLAQSPYTSDTTKDSKVFKVPDESNARTSNTKTVILETKKLSKAEVEKELERKPLVSKSEEFTYTEPEDKVKNSSNTYFVIVGSFLNINNAETAKSRLTDLGFNNPIILHSETGYYRVCVNSYQAEADARSRVADIRINYPKYSDAWLLIKK